MFIIALLLFRIFSHFFAIAIYISHFILSLALVHNADIKRNDLMHGNFIAVEN